jgi:hypothetical protein
MATSKKFSKENTIYVSVPPKLTLEQTHQVTAEILRIAGCPGCYSGFKILFGDESEFIAASVGERNQVSVSTAN